jgi:hypothetical protein
MKISMEKQTARGLGSAQAVMRNSKGEVDQRARGTPRSSSSEIRIDMVSM